MNTYIHQYSERYKEREKEREEGPVEEEECRRMVMSLNRHEQEQEQNREKMIDEKKREGSFFLNENLF